MTGALPISDFDYDYPEDLVAVTPSVPRDSSRLLVLDRTTDKIKHAFFHDLPQFLRSGDCLVLNRTKVSLCRLIGRKASGGKADVLLVAERSPGHWTGLASGFKTGQILIFDAGLTARVEGLSTEGEYLLAFSSPDMRSYLAEHGLPPLPPYIAKKRAASRADAAVYQTIYAQDTGSIAAPTAGLHFTDELLQRLACAGIEIAWLTLHVGRGTFRPIIVNDAQDHLMLPEQFSLDAHEAAKMAAVKMSGRRLIAVGTTATRVIETLSTSEGGFKARSGETSLYIRPGHDFQGIDALITNFHLPRSTPLLLASAFAGRERLLSAYREAIARRYRLFSFGDATLIQ